MGRVNSNPLVYFNNWFITPDTFLCFTSYFFRFYLFITPAIIFRKKNGCGVLRLEVGQRKENLNWNSVCLLLSFHFRKDSVRLVEGKENLQPLAFTVLWARSTCEFVCGVNGRRIGYWEFGISLSNGGEEGTKAAFVI